MTDREIAQLAAELEMDPPRRLWGVSPASTYAAIDAVATGESLERALSRYYKLELAATNQERDRASVVEFHRRLVRTLGLAYDGSVTELGVLILQSDEPRELLQVLISVHSVSARRLLRDCLAIEDIVPRREYEALLRDVHEEQVLTPLLGSFDLLQVFRDGVELNEELARQGLDVFDTASIETARSELYRRILPSLLEVDNTTANEVAAAYLEQLTERQLSETEIIGTIGADSAERFEETAIQAAAMEVRAEYEQMSTRISELLSGHEESLKVFEDDELSPASLEEYVELRPVSELTAILTTIAEEGMTHVSADFIASRLGAPVYDCFTGLKSITQVECELRDEVLVFSRVPEVVEGKNVYDQYVKYLLDEHATLAEQVSSLTDIDLTVKGTKVDEILGERFHSIDDRQLAPTYFTFTLINPDSLGEEMMDEYVGDSKGLRQERARLRRWHESRPSGLRTYTAMTDRLFSLGLEEDLDHRVVRLMTPFDDDTFGEYAAQFRRLLEEGYELRLLTRHTKEPWEWERLRDNLLKKIESNRDRVSVRTYSRFKEHQRVIQETDTSRLGEIGIHGKLHIIGDSHEGAALLGSANFMENSYHWNPECGVYSEKRPFVESAIQFFDIVWELSDADQLSLDRLQEIPDRRFVPSYYTP